MAEGRWPKAVYLPLQVFKDDNEDKFSIYCIGMYSLRAFLGTGRAGFFRAYSSIDNTIENL